MEWLKFFKLKKRKSEKPDQMMRGFEETARKTGKKTFFRKDMEKETDKK